VSSVFRPCSLSPRGLSAVGQPTWARTVKGKGCLQERRRYRSVCVSSPPSYPSITEVSSPDRADTAQSGYVSTWERGGQRGRTNAPTPPPRHIGGFQHAPVVADVLAVPLCKQKNQYQFLWAERKRRRRKRAVFDIVPVQSVQKQLHPLCVTHLRESEPLSVGPVGSIRLPGVEGEVFQRAGFRGHRIRRGDVRGDRPFNDGEVEGGKAEGDRGERGEGDEFGKDRVGENGVGREGERLELRQRPEEGVVERCSGRRRVKVVDVEIEEEGLEVFSDEVEEVGEDVGGETAASGEVEALERSCGRSEEVEEGGLGEVNGVK
jgi:hypothetical protein